jgi:hypothetical protein
MIIEIVVDGESRKEWALLEVQGEVLGDLNGPLGQISISGKIAVLEIGQHILEGEVVSLKQSFLVIEKSSVVSNNQSKSVAGIIRKKIVFSSRPKTKKIVGK